MTQTLRLAIAAVIGTATFLATALGIEFLSWYWIESPDLYSDPNANAVRFIAAGLVALATTWRVMRRKRIVLAR